MPKTTTTAASSPSNPPEAPPSPSPAPLPSAADAFVLPSTSKLPVDFSPPLIAMVVVVAAAFLIVTYSRLISRHLLPPLLRLLRRFSRWRRRRRRRRSYLPSSSAGDLDSPRFDSPPFDAALHALSPYGLDESVIKTLPLAIYYTAKSGILLEDARECAVCLLEFDEDDYVRTLPVCSHAFHVDCIDVWLRSHANCPLCRACIFRPQSPFVPLMAARIRPSLDDSLLRSIALQPLTESIDPDSHRTTATEITQCTEEASPPPRRINSDDRFPNGRDFFLKRSYSFGFERSVASERMVLEPATTSPWRYRRGIGGGGGGGGSFWSKRPSPFGSVSKASRVFSFRSYRKSPAFFRRRGFIPLSESTRRTKSMTSPMFSLRSSSTAAFSSSRLRCGDPEALLSPERFNRR